MVQRSGAAPRGSLHLMQAAILPWRAEPGPAGDAAFIAQGQALAARGRRASLFAGEDLPPG